MTPVLYLSYDGLTDQLGQSQILPYLEGLSKCGYRFTVISFEKSGRYKDGKRRIEKRCKAANIIWQPLEYTKNPPVVSTLYDIDKLYRNAEALHKERDFALVHCRSYITCLVALRLKKTRKIPFIFDMRGFWADERVDGKIWDLNNPVYKQIYRYFKKRERTFLEEAEAIVSLTEAGKNELENWYNEDPLFGGKEDYYNYDHAAAILKKTTVIPCTTDLHHFDFSRISPNKRKWLGAVYGIEPDREYLGYVGSLGTWYMEDEMLELYHALLGKNANLRFLIVSHDDIESVYQKARERGIPRSYLIQVAAERKDVPALISMMAASVFFILPAYSKKASSPTKQGELMAMGIPVICNDGVGDTGEIVRKYHAGYVTAGLAEADFCKIAEYWPQITGLDPKIIRSGAEDYFSLEKGVEKYHRIYERVLVGGSEAVAAP